MAITNIKGFTYKQDDVVNTALLDDTGYVDVNKLVFPNAKKQKSTSFPKFPSQLNNDIPKEAGLTWDRNLYDTSKIKQIGEDLNYQLLIDNLKKYINAKATVYFNAEDYIGFWSSSNRYGSPEMILNEERDFVILINKQAYKPIIRIIANEIIDYVDFSIMPDFNFALDYDNKKAIYRLLFPYKSIKDYVIVLEFDNYVDFSLIMSHLGLILRQDTSGAQPLVISEFLKAIASVRKAKKNEILNWIYKEAPHYVFTNIEDIDLYSDLLELLKYGGGWFKNSSLAIYKNLLAYKNKYLIYQLLKFDSKEVMKIYKELANDELKETYCQLLASLCYDFADKKDKENLSLLLYGKDYSFNTDLFSSSDGTIKIRQYKQISMWKGENVGVLVSECDFDPMQLIIVRNADNPNEFEVVPAIYVKLLSDKKSWDEIKKALKIVMLVSFILLSAYAVAVVAIEAAVGGIEAVSAASLLSLGVNLPFVLTNSGELYLELLDDTPENKEIKEHWKEIIDLVNTGVCTLAIGELVVNGVPAILRKLSVGVMEIPANVKETLPKLLELRTGAKDFLNRALFLALLNIEITNFVPRSLKYIACEYRILYDIAKFEGVAPFAESTVKSLYEADAVIVQGEKLVGNKLIDSYAVLYGGEVITEGSFKEVRDTINKLAKEKGGLKNALETALERLLRWKFKHILTSGAKITELTKKGTFLVGSFGSDLEFVLNELNYPLITELPNGYKFPLPKGQKFNLLNVSQEIYQYFVKNGGFFTNVNSKWVDAAVEQGADIIVASDFRFLRSPVYNEYGELISYELTGFGKEIHRLEWKHNYRFDSETKMMLPPEKANGLQPVTKMDEYNIK